MIEQMIKNGWWGESPFVDRLILNYPAHPTNYYTDRRCQPIAWFWHEPQEPADNRESTPIWFATFHGNPLERGSTTYYGDNDGDVYQCVPLDRAPIANGWTGDIPIPRFSDGGPEFGAFSLNEQSHSSEEEGYTHSIHQTFTNAQFLSCVDRAALFLIMYDLPRNPKRVGLAHADVATDRSDGIWIARKSGIPQEAVNKVLKLEKDILELKGSIWNLATENNARKGEIQQFYRMAFAPAQTPSSLDERLDKLEHP